MRRGFLLNAKPDQCENSLGPLQDERIINRWAVAAAQDRLGRASYRWELPNPHQVETSRNPVFEDADVCQSSRPTENDSTLFTAANGDHTTTNTANRETLRWGRPMNTRLDPSQTVENSTPRWMDRPKHRTITASTLVPGKRWNIPIPTNDPTVTTTAFTNDPSTHNDIATVTHPTYKPLFRGVRLHPTLHGAPKNALHALYGKPPRNLQSEKSDYFTWSEGPPHNTLYSSVFVCPITGECFPSGRFGDAPHCYVVKTDPATGLAIVYYKKKINAEHGAAARAYDCLIYRDYNGDETLCDYVGVEDPSESPHAIPLPSVIPPMIQQAIIEAQMHRRTQKSYNSTKDKDDADMNLDTSLSG